MLRFQIKSLRRVTHKYKKEKKEKQKRKKKWAKFIYVGRQTKFITKLFKNDELEVSFKTENTIGKLLTQNNKNISFNKLNKNVSTK